MIAMVPKQGLVTDNQICAPFNRRFNHVDISPRSSHNAGAFFIAKFIAKQNLIPFHIRIEFLTGMIIYHFIDNFFNLHFLLLSEYLFVSLFV